MKLSKWFGIFISTVIFFIIICSCGDKAYYFRSNYNSAVSLLHNTKNLRTKPFLKAHLKNGDVFILRDSWTVDTLNNTISGSGERYDFNRRRIFTGKFKIPFDSVAIYETNKKLEGTEIGRIATLSIIAGADIALGIYCQLHPKDCFGSCPTFYINENDNFHYANAEGFTNAISPSLEYADIDALNNSYINGKTFSLTMKNEALETHCVKDVKLLAYPRKEGERVFHSGCNDYFYLCENTYYASKATGNEGDITSLIKYDDKQERYSLSDENNLKSREEIIIDFNNIPNTNNLGLRIGFRQTLMSTYYIYSALGYMGDEVGDYINLLEKDKEIANNLKAGIYNELGNIDVYLFDEASRKWIYQGYFNETGPIAINHQIIPFDSKLVPHFDSKEKNIKIKLILNKGLWRIDYLTLTNIKQQVHPTALSPELILNKGNVDNSAISSLISHDKYIISMPGSQYKFIFRLPEPNQDYELFVYSKGYYLEWIRESWLKYKDLLKLQQMIYYPKDYLKQTAGDYKTYENFMEQEFWNSRIDTRSFSY